MKTITYTLHDIDTVAAQLWALHEHCAVYTFKGHLGAGKTTLIRAMLAQAGVMQPVTSPTFTYINLYTNNSGHTFYHFDLYRVPTDNEFLAQGFDEYLYLPNSWCFIEWPEPIMVLMTKRVCHTSLDYVSDELRTLQYQVVP